MVALLISVKISTLYKQVNMIAFICGRIKILVNILEQCSGSD